MLRYCTFSSRYTTTWCYATARSLQGIQLRDATLLHVLFKVYNYVMLRYCTFSSRYTTTWCYATARSLQGIQLRDATLTGVGGWVGGGGDVNVHWTCTRTWCYATARSLQFTQLRGCYATARSLQGIQLRDATLLHVLFKVYNYVMLRYCTFSSSYTTTWCYATARSLQGIQLRDATFTSSSFALAHSCHATLRSLGAVGGVLASSFFDLKIFTQGVVFYMHLMLNSTHMCHLNMVSLQVSQVSMFIMHYVNTFGRRVPKKKHLKLQARRQRVKKVMKMLWGVPKTHVPGQPYSVLFSRFMMDFNQNVQKHAKTLGFWSNWFHRCKCNEHKNTASYRRRHHVFG